MGVFSWFTDSAKKSAAAALIQTYLEVSQRFGVFNGDAAGAANQLVELACARVPELPSQRYTKCVMASVALAIGLLEEDESLVVRDHIAMALEGMLKLAETERHKHSYEEQDVLARAANVLRLFREVVPSPPMSSLPRISSIDAKELGHVAVPESPQHRELAMDELIKRMRA